MDTVFVVIRSDGEYSDRYETVLGYFSMEAEAQEFCANAERQWREAGAAFPEPEYPSGLVLLQDDYDLVWPNREISNSGGVRFVTTDYSKEPARVPVPDDERERRVAARKAYANAYDLCMASRQNAVTLDKDGEPDSTWYYQAAAPLAGNEKEPRNRNAWPAF